MSIVLGWARALKHYEGEAYPLNCRILILAGLFVCNAWAGQIPIELMLPEMPVDAEGDRNVFATPFDYRNGNLFTVHVEPAGAGGQAGINLRTTVRKGVRQPDAGWVWESTVIEERTLSDSWHAQASIALDKGGYVHVAYNMHNMPWQYSVSSRPLDISSFDFRGQAISEAERAKVKFMNKTPFPDAGTAVIPGNQVTYPTFFADRYGDLYLTYRFALKPAQSWDKRAFAGAIAKYDVTSRQWRSIGGEVIVSAQDAKPAGGKGETVYLPFAYEEGYSVYLITLAFDGENGMHVFWNWRAGGAGMDTVKPSHAYSPDGIHFFRSDGHAYSLPIGYEDAEPIGRNDREARYYAPKSAALLPTGEPIAVLHPITGGREIVRYDQRTGRWADPESSPHGATEIVVDRLGRQWAFASGLKVFMRTPGSASWREMGEIGTGLCHPKVKYDPSESMFIVHAKTCDDKQATIVSFQH